MDMRALIKLLGAAAALAMSTGAAFAAMGKTTTDVAVLTAPGAQAEVIRNLPADAIVSVGHCARDWCGVTWDKYGGYVRESALQLQGRHGDIAPAIPVYPRYPYRAGHYPTADSYNVLPPYADINPAFYSRRNFMLAQERNRYRYVPYIFHRSEAQRYQ
jgi:uncharacterized protein YraI